MTFINTLLFILKFIDKYEQHYYCIRIVVKYSTGAEILKKHIAGIEDWISRQKNNAVPFSHIVTVEHMADLAKTELCGTYKLLETLKIIQRKGY